MNKQCYKKIFIFLVLLIAILNIGLITKLILDNRIDGITSKTFTISIIIAIAIQICIIIISTVIIKKFQTIKRMSLLIMLSIAFLIITFFIPIKMKYKYPQSNSYGLTPTVMPRRIIL